MSARALLLAAILAALPDGGSAAVPPAPTAKPTMPAAQPPAAQPSTAVLAQSGGYQLTRADADAYVDALVFCLAQAGQDPARLANDRAVVRDYLADSFPTMPEAAQTDLADMTGIWDRARGQWENLAVAERNAFSYGVLSLAFGEQDASRILRWNPRGAMVEGTPEPGRRPGLAGSSELECIMTGNCGGSGVRLPE